MSKNSTKYLLLLFFIFAFVLAENKVFAFGAGNIPSFSYLEGKAFRHGDIEDILSDLVKKGGGGGFALSSLVKSKFGGLDIKRVYFGNWLRDYSQAVDIGVLKKLQLQTIINLCMALGFLAHGYATGEFEVTEARLGVYLPTEHIDNPKGYGDGEDPRKYHPKLRGPVDPRELEVDPRTGMKNYIANEQGGWDTSKALVRRTLEQCIHLGRQHRAQSKKADEYEAYRLLGQALHTLEDFSAHSNFCELALVAMGFQHVFVHVGDQVRIQAANGKWVAPLVTGTFGGSDFMHSLLGEAGDKLSEASVSDLNEKVSAAQATSATRSRSGGGNDGDTLRDLLFKLPGTEGSEMSREMESVERIRAAPAQGGKKPEEMSPQELHAVLWSVLTWRDSVVKKIEKTIEKIPGLGPMIERLMESISVFVFTTLEPYLKPILQSASGGIMNASTEVIDTHDQYEVFNDPRASDPTHSFLSKDHFNLILNEPAGQIARVIVQHTVTLVVKAWDNNSVNVRETAEDILQCLFHPDFHNPNSKVQREMMQCMRNWVQSLGNKQNEILQRLSKEAVRNHTNIRPSSGHHHGPAGYVVDQAHHAQAAISGYMHNIPAHMPHMPHMPHMSGANHPQQMFRDGPGGPGYGGPPMPGDPSTQGPPMPGVQMPGEPSAQGPPMPGYPPMPGDQPSGYPPPGDAPPPFPQTQGYAPAYPPSGYDAPQPYPPPQSYPHPPHGGPPPFPGPPSSAPPQFPDSSHGYGAASSYYNSPPPPPGGYYGGQ